jgi:hypothetical protein
MEIACEFVTHDDHTAIIAQWTESLGADTAELRAAKEDSLRFIDELRARDASDNLQCGGGRLLLDAAPELDAGNPT